MGFAIPIERVLRIAEDLLEDGQVRRAWLGLQVEPEEADAYGRTRGVRVARVGDPSPASQSGIRAGDRLVELNGMRLTTPLDFEAVLLELRPGDRVSLLPDGSASPVALVAEELPSVQAERIRVFEDLELVSLTQAIRTERNVESEAGALVTGISVQLQGILGLREGDVIVALGNRRVQGAEDLVDVLSQVPPGSWVRLYFERNRGIAAQDFFLGR
jgi:serine protease Do